MNSSRVVLLHGLGRNKCIMQPLEKHLVAEGYNVYNDDYVSRQYSVEDCAEQIYRRIHSYFAIDKQSLHFVGHSLGGIIIRYLLAHFSFSNVGRVILIGTPNQGTPIVDFLRHFPWYRWTYGPAGQQLGTGKDSIIHQLPKRANFECGIIAGNRTVDPWFSWTLLPGPNDGKVTVESTKLDGMQDFQMVPVAHPHLPKRLSVIQLVSCFLKTGRFH